MKFLTVCLAALFLLGGCSYLEQNLCPPGSSKLSRVDNLLEKGNEPAATKLLEEIVNSRNTAEGTTDQALFMLSLLELRKNDDSAFQSIRKNFARLQTEYPESRWARISWPLTEYLSRMESIKTDNRDIKKKNSSLVRENRELTQSNQQLQGTVQNLTKENRDINQRIEMLKSLDLELEKKKRR